MLLVDAVDELAANDALGEQTWTMLSAHYSPEQMLELIAMAGFYRMLAGILNSVQVKVEADMLADGAGEPAGG